MRKPEYVNRRKVSGTFNRRSGKYNVHVLSIRKDQPCVRPQPYLDELGVHVSCKRQSMADGKLESHSKTFSIKRAVYRKLSRFSKELSQWFDEHETPLETKFDALILVKKVSRSSNCFRLLRYLAISIDIVDLKEEPIEDLEKNCAICLEDLESETVLSCSHSFHEDCIGIWLQKQSNCPLCRFKLDSDQVEEIRRRPSSS